ncbi:isoprenylcysteine carboxylmethyltransferase family protein [Nocardia higoensis]|uniref:Isoprenylcysteine carboxylmethyltransferase family protein n=1 Tax=Nocardia higoensis TaxID=228599 RepID=A0ABS0D4H0_9NOCA|nr:isoprenylcysteine carboxylmethyltransferase family protein [Nocardia higoensis]MBF6353231.1 isoprenylcysteine carboxylmethyltransferase family protein [Nocardia higoensis]
MRRVPPPVIAAAAAGVQYLQTRGRRPTPWSGLAAAPFTAAAATLAAWAVSRFADKGTTVNPMSFDKVTTLVTDGPNRFTRNPMYLGLASALTAHAVLRRSAWALLPTAGFVALIDRTQIPAEEQALAERFGEQYEQYRNRVLRWIGPPRA